MPASEEEQIIGQIRALGIPEVVVEDDSLRFGYHCSINSFWLINAKLSMQDFSHVTVYFIPTIIMILCGCTISKPHGCVLFKPWKSQVNLLFQP